jgi:hypothetical protein
VNQGAKRHALSERGNDLYESPACAPAALLLHEPLVKLADAVWEPCAGRGAISRVLKAAGKQVLSQDLVAYEGADADVQPGVDFFKTRKAPFRDALIITNPPFMHADEFILHGLDLGWDVIVLLRLMAQEGVDGKHKGSGVRSKLIDEHLVRVWLGRERLPMMHREGWTGPKIKGGSSGAPFAWFVFEARPHASDQGYVTRRISWRVPVPRAETDLFAGAEGWL